MKKHIEEINGYIANNPFIRKEPFKHWFMRNSFLLHKKLCITISKWHPLSDWQKARWLNERGFYRRREANAAVNCIDVDNKIAAQPTFDIEFISILELIPKEQMNDVISGIEKFEKNIVIIVFMIVTLTMPDIFKIFMMGMHIQVSGT
ncbi:MAG TPA: hypothetical protein PK733_16635 [Clostridiales bacterium]|nr:hypothetical protein [Clostridiales bacterium]